MKKIFYYCLTLCFMLLGLVHTSYALSLVITPTGYSYGSLAGSWTLSVNEWNGATNPVSPNTSENKVNEMVQYLISSPDNQVYKQNVGESTDSGILNDSYSTVFSDSVAEPSSASITYTGGAIISPNHVYLVVKDGNASPWWYLFDLSNIWNGTDGIVLNEFWTGYDTQYTDKENGSISHVSIYGGTSSAVPEPATMLLFGTGIAGLAGIARRKRD